MTNFFGRERVRERGIALILVMVVMGALLVGGTVGLGQLVRSIRSSGVTGENRRNTYCAEAGLAAGANFFRTPMARANWNTYIQTGFRLIGKTGPAESGLTYSVYIIDDADEFPPATNTPLNFEGGPGYAPTGSPYYANWVANTGHKNYPKPDNTVIMISKCFEGTADEQMLAQILTLDRLNPTGLVYTTSNDKVTGLPTSSSANATLLGSATVAQIGAANAVAGLKATSNAVQLNGVDAAASFGSATEMNGTKAVEVALWFKADTAQTAYATLMSKSHGAAANNTGWTVEFDSTGRYVQFGVYTTVQTGGASVFTTQPVNDNRWHHLLGRYDGQRVALYLDSVLQGWVIASGDVRVNNGPLSVGRWDFGPSRYYKGYIAEIRVRSWQDPIFTPFDGGMGILFGNQTQDLAGNYFFNGGSLTQALDTPSLSGREGLDVDFWFMADPSQTTSATLLSKGHGAASGNTGWSVEFAGAGGVLVFGVYTSTMAAGVQVPSLRGMNDNLWHRFRGTFDGRYITMYIDDVFQGRRAATGDILANDRPLTIGAWELGPSRYYRGRIRDLTVRSYNDAIIGLDEGLVVLDANTTVSTGHDGRAPSMVFNGTSSWARIPDNFTAIERRPLDGPRGIEVALWMRASPSQVASSTIISKSHGAASNNTGWTMEFDGMGRTVGFGVYATGGTAGVSSRFPLNDDKWHELRGVYNGRWVLFYVDRVLQGRAPLSGTILPNVKPATVGRWELGPSRHFRGQIDSLRVNPMYTMGAPDAAQRFMVQSFSPGAGYGIGSGFWMPLDFTGDRMSDLAHICCANYMHPWGSRGDGYWDVWYFSPGAGYGIQSGQWAKGDFNGDGREDLMHICCANYVHPWFSNGDGTFNVLYFSPGAGYGVQLGTWKTGDFNGDGKTDLAHICCSNYIHLWFSNGDGTFNVTYFSPGAGYGVQSGQWQTGDFNGDGKTDLAHICCSNYIHPWYSNGDGSFNVGYFSPGAGYGVQSGTWLTGDFNGDGITDLLHRCCGNYVHPWISNGVNGFNVLYYSPGGGYSVQNGEFRIGDLNEDGIDDVLHLVYGSNYVHTWMGSPDGQSFSLGYYSPWAAYGIPNGRFATGDFNRDGKMDLMHLVASDYMHSWIGQN